MVKPTDRDVVFELPSHDNHPYRRKKLYSHTTGNRIYQGLLDEYCVRYHHPFFGTPTRQKAIRKLIVDKFHERIDAQMEKTNANNANDANTKSNKSNNNNNNTANNNNNNNKAQFLIHMKQGTSFCFVKVFFKAKIDEKIVSFVCRTVL